MKKIIFTNLFVLSFGLIYAGLLPADILDIPSIIFVFIPAFVAPFGIYGKSHYSTAFASVFKRREIDSTDKEGLAGFFTLMGNVAVGFGWIAFFIGHIAMLKNITQDLKIELYATGFAASLITVMYGYVFKYGFCEVAEKRMLRK